LHFTPFLTDPPGWNAALEGDELAMSDKRIGQRDPANVRPGKSVDTQAVAAPFQKGQSASNLLGALAGKPGPEAGGTAAGTSAAAQGNTKKS
jgi:hypothetical protein